MFQVNLYTIQNGKCFPIDPKNASELNEARGDIYWTFNNFKAPGHRKKEDLREITCFFCEIDVKNKGEQKEIIMSRLIPSCVIETKRGFHLYWYLKDFIDCSDDPVGKADWFRDILKNRICPALGADSQAADACRLLRAPFYKYWKDGKGTFITDIVFESDKRYTVEEILRAFPVKTPQISHENAPPLRKVEGSDLWSRANNLNVLNALERLSGSHAVNGETYAFKKQSGITRILCNGKKSNAWIDANGKIGSTDGAGPSIPNWLHYYAKDWAKVAKLIEEFFPEIIVERSSQNVQKH